MIVEGGRVSYVGEGEFGLQVGDQGKVLVDDGRACHVLWLTGSCAGKTLFHDYLDLVGEATTEASYGEPVVRVAVRDIYDRKGHAGLLAALSEEGVLDVFDSIAAEAIEMVAQRIRGDLAFSEVVAQLGYDDGEEFVDYASRILLSEAFGRGEE